MEILVVDLDGTLVKTDLLYEQAFSFLKKNPLNIFKLVYWTLFTGLIGLKKNLGMLMHPKVETLPYRKDVLEFIKEKKKENFKIVLASASPKPWVDRVAGHLGLFDVVIGTEEKNLKGKDKHTEIVRSLGNEQYIYIGDSAPDVEVWKLCGAAVTVNVSPGVIREIKKSNTRIISEISDRKAKLKVLVKQARLHQWAKNALVFLPLLAAHKFEPSLLVKCLVGFVGFGLAASAVYVFNDLIDIDADRNHHSKRNRPLAAGTLSIKDALIMFMALGVGALIVSASVDPAFMGVIVFYWALNLLYTFYLKSEVILDIIILSGMYTIRIFAGAVAVNVPVSHWLLSFSTLFFFSLACVKRFTELSRSQNKPTIDGRGYRGMDQSSVQVLGIATGMVSILVTLLYLQSPDNKSLYSDASRLWVLTPLLLYWLGRIWVLASRNEVHDDPVVFAVKDKISWICFGIILVAMVSAK